MSPDVFRSKSLGVRSVSYQSSDVLGLKVVYFCRPLNQTQLISSAHYLMKYVSYFLSGKHSR